MLLSIKDLTIPMLVRIYNILTFLLIYILFYLIDTILNMSIRLPTIFLLILTLTLVSIQASAVQPAVAGEVHIPANAYTEKSLDVHVNSPANFTFNKFNASENLSISIANPTGGQMTAYTALYRHHKWNKPVALGDIGPGENRTFTYPMSFT